MPNLAAQTSDQSPTPNTLNTTLYLNIFQGEPAISEFDWHITPYHSSSDTLAAVTGTDLLPDFSGTHPDHGRLTRFRVVQQLQ
jgi:hypothetical protein